MEKVVSNLEELATEAQELVRRLSPRSEGATLVTLSGELGAGKTAFAKAVARALGVGEVVTSPTFVLEKIYELPDRASFKRLVHIDAYRLETGNELAPLGFAGLMRDSGNLVLLEWPEKVADALPPPTLVIRFEVVSETERTLTYG